MFESLLPALTFVALGLLVPAGVVAMVLARGRHASVSSGGDRGGRVAVAAGLAAAAGGTVAWFLGAGLVVALLTSVLLAVPVVLWAYLAPWWPVRAVVAWAMLVTGSIGAVGLATARALESPNPWTALPVAAVGATLTVFVLERLNGPFRRLLGIRAGIRRAVRTPVFLRPALLRPALALAVFFAALAAGGLTGVAPRPGDARTPQAGAGPEPGRGSGGSGTLDADDVRTVSADVTTPSESVGMVTGSAAGGAARGSASSGARGGSATDGAATTAAARDGAGSTTTATGTSSDAGSTSGGSSTGGTSGSTGGTDGTGGTGGTDEPVRTVTDTVSSTTETVQKTTETVVDTVEKTADSVTDGGSTATEPVRSVVEETVEPVTSVVEDTTEPVTSLVDSTVDQVTDPLESALP